MLLFRHFDIFQEAMFSCPNESFVSKIFFFFILGKLLFCICKYFTLTLQLLFPCRTFQSRRHSNSRLPCYENTLWHLLSDVKDESEPNNRQEAVTPKYRKPGGNLQHKTDWKRETIIVLLPLIYQNNIDLRSTLAARTVCCLAPSTYYFQQLTSGSWLTELDYPSLNEQMLTKISILRAG